MRAKHHGGTMTDVEPRSDAASEPAILAALNGLQDQLDAIMDMLGEHQRVFEAMRAAGQLPDHVGGGQEP